MRTIPLFPMSEYIDCQIRKKIIFKFDCAGPVLFWFGPLGFDNTDPEKNLEIDGNSIVIIPSTT